MASRSRSDVESWSAYAKMMLDERLWRRAADDLFEAARAVEPRVQEFWNIVMADINARDPKDTEVRQVKMKRSLQPTYTMLVAFAVENLLKGAIICQNRDQFRAEVAEGGGCLPAIARGHDLFRLAKTAHFPMKPDDEQVLRRLSRNATWAGRYPVPLEHGRMGWGEVFSDGTSRIEAASYPANDVDRLNELVERVQCYLNECSSRSRS